MAISCLYSGNPRILEPLVAQALHMYLLYIIALLSSFLLTKQVQWYWIWFNWKHLLLFAYLHSGNSILVPPNIQALNICNVNYTCFENIHHCPMKLLFLHIDLLTQPMQKVHMLWTLNIEQQYLRLINHFVTRRPPNLPTQPFYFEILRYNSYCC